MLAVVDFNILKSKNYFFPSAIPRFSDWLGKLCFLGKMYFKFEFSKTIISQLSFPSPPYGHEGAGVIRAQK
jgi:hypothetical protein